MPVMGLAEFAVRLIVYTSVAGRNPLASTPSGPIWLNVLPFNELVPVIVNGL